MMTDAEIAEQVMKDRGISEFQHFMQFMDSMNMRIMKQMLKDAADMGRQEVWQNISEPENPPSLEKSIDVLTAMAASTTGLVELIESFASIHFGQAVVIRGERGRTERAEAELQARELHHFETEQIIEQIKAIHVAGGYVNAFYKDDRRKCAECGGVWPCKTMGVLG